MARIVTHLVCYVSDNKSFALQCKCKTSDEAKTLTAMGCPKGGFAWGSDTAAECQDGTILNMPADAMKHYLKKGDNGCLCPDGIFPK